MPTISYFNRIEGRLGIGSSKAGVISYSTLKLSKMMNKTVNWYINRGFSQKMAEYFVSGRRTILDVKANQDFTLSLLFDNDEKKIFDMKELIQPNTIFECLADWKIFSRVYLDSNSVVSWDKNLTINSEENWQNKIDISSDTLYVDSIQV